MYAKPRTAAWDVLFGLSFNRALAEERHAAYRESGTWADLEAVFNAYVPLAGNVFYRKGIKHQDFDDALSAISTRLWACLQDDRIQNITGYLSAFFNNAAINFMRSHPLYSRKLNQPVTPAHLPRRQLSLPDALYLEETLRRIPELITELCERRVRHGGVFRAALLDVIRCYAAGGEASPVLLARKHTIGVPRAAKLCQVAQVLVREAKRKLKRSVRGLQFYDSELR